MKILIVKDDNGIRIADKNVDLLEIFDVLRYAINYYSNEGLKLVKEIKDIQDKIKKDCYIEPKNNIEGEWNDTTGQGTD